MTASLGRRFLAISALLLLGAGLAGCGSRFDHIKVKKGSGAAAAQSSQSSSGSSDSGYSSGPVGPVSPVTMVDQATLLMRKSRLVREAEDKVRQAFEIKECTEAFQALKQGDLVKSRDLYSRAVSKSGSNPYLKARLKHVELMIQRQRAGSNHALNEALEIYDDPGRLDQAIALAEDAVSADPSNLVVKQQSNMIIYEIMKNRNPQKANRARKECFDARLLMNRIESQSTNFVVNYGEGQ